MKKSTIILIIAAFFTAMVVAFCFVSSAVLSRFSPGYEVIDGTAYYKSYDNVNFKVKRVEVKGADAKLLKTIKRSGGQYASDGTSVFYEGNSLTDADPKSFEVLDWREGFSRDSNRAYYHSFALSDDPENFQPLAAGYSKDQTSVYHNRTRIEGAELKTFQVTNEVSFKARDKNHEYNLGRRVDNE